MSSSSDSNSPALYRSIAIAPITALSVQYWSGDVQGNLLSVAGLLKLFAEASIGCDATADTDCFQACLFGCGDGFFDEAIDDCLLEARTDVVNFLLRNFDRFEIDFTGAGDGVADGCFESTKTKV